MRRQRLYLYVDPSRARRWVQRLVIRGKSRALGLGSYALVSLAEARVLALGRQQTVVRHMLALPHGEVASAVAAVRASQAWTGTKLAFEFLVLTAARSGEVRLATWDEIDLDAAVWAVPGSRMKAKCDHRVPLYGRAGEILNETRTLGGGTGLVFPSRRGKPLGDVALWRLVKQQGIAAVPHGFRSSFRLSHGDLSGPGGVTIVPTGTALEERTGAKRSLQVV